jgi:hypothetical protein
MSGRLVADAHAAADADDSFAAAVATDMGEGKLNAACPTYDLINQAKPEMLNCTTPSLTHKKKDCLCYCVNWLIFQRGCMNLLV